MCTMYVTYQTFSQFHCGCSFVLVLNYFWGSRLFLVFRAKLGTAKSNLPTLLEPSITSRRWDQMLAHSMNSAFVTHSGCHLCPRTARCFQAYLGLFLYLGDSSRLISLSLWDASWPAVFLPEVRVWSVTPLVSLWGTMS